MDMASPGTSQRERDWRRANHEYLLAQIERVRLLLHRRVLWLRHCWTADPLQPSSGLVVSDVQVDRLLTRHDRADEARFQRDDPAARQLSDELHELGAALDRRRGELADAGTPAALDTLGYLFDLTAFEQDVLLLCLAPELDPEIGQLYAYVQDDARRGYPTPHLARAVSSAVGDGGWRSFLPGAPLRRSRLIQLDPGPPGATPGDRALRLDERVHAYLHGVDTPERRIDDLLLPAPAAPLTSRQHNLIDQLVRWQRSAAEQSRRPVINLVGPDAVAATVARGLVDRLGIRLYRLDPAQLPASSAERRGALQLLLREAVLGRFAVFVDAGHGRDLGLLEPLEQLDMPMLLIGSPQRRSTGSATLTVRVPEPGPDGQRELWLQTLAARDGQVGADEIDAIVQQFVLGPRDIVEVVAAAGGRARSRPDDEHEITADDVWQACREQSGPGLDDLARRIPPRYRWDDIVLPADGLEQLQEIAAQVADRPQVYDAWGFSGRLGPSRGISALFAGPSGTGKTMAAEILAGSLRLDLYRVDLAGVVSKYIGETEKNLRRVFDAAERSGAILCFDEADALFGKRSEVKDSHDRYANIEIDYLLQRMEDYRGLAILTTNRKAALDRAFLRRLRFLVEFPFPDAELRRRIWQRSFPPEAPVGDLDWGALARLEIPGGNIRNIALNAAFLAARADSEISADHILRAARREYAKTDRLIDPAEFGALTGPVPA